MDLGVIHAVFLGLGSFDGVLYGKFFVLLGWKRERKKEKCWRSKGEDLGLSVRVWSGVYRYCRDLWYGIRGSKAVWIASFRFMRI